MWMITSEGEWRTTQPRDWEVFAEEVECAGVPGFPFWLFVLSSEYTRIGVSQFVIQFVKVLWQFYVELRTPGNLAFW
jgi:hypothetical protein